MADRDKERERDRDRDRDRERATDIMKSILPEKGPSKSQVMAVITLLPLGGFLLLLSGLTLAGTVLGLALCTPVFILFSPVLVPAALTIGLAVTGFLTSGAFGMTALSSLSWMVNYLRSLRVPEKIDQAKRQLQETAGQLGQKAKETAQTVQSKAQEGGRAIEGAGRRAQEVGKEKESGKA